MPDDENIIRFDTPIKVIEFDDDYEDSLGSTPPNQVALEELHYSVQRAINEREDRRGFEAFKATALTLPDCHPSGVIYLAVNRTAKVACCVYEDRRLLSKIHPHQIDIAIGPVWIEATGSEDQTPDQIEEQSEEEFTEVVAAKRFFEILNDIEDYC